MLEQRTCRICQAIVVLANLVGLLGCTLEPEGIARSTSYVPPLGQGGQGGLGGDGALGGGGGAAGGGGAPAFCGNGKIDSGEACDDGNQAADDGCAGCVVELGFICPGEPSVCKKIAPQNVAADLPNGVLIPDGTYDGTVNSMGCVVLTVPDEGWTSVQHVEIALGIKHNFVGDLIIKMKSPKGTLTTLMNRPGSIEPVDATYESPNGDDSNLEPAYPIFFRDGETISAESMGNTISTGQVVCKDDQICSFNPARGLGEGMNGLADFNGENPVGNWIVCVGDGDSVDEGRVMSASLSVLSY